jgi:MFS transporter, DHA1 family, tetracycline resistance protein
MKKTYFFPILSLCLILFIDGLGQGIMLPIFAETLTSEHSQILLVGSSETVKQLYYGLVIGLFFLSWFYGSAVLGDLSDRIGRKKTLLICLLGLLIGNLLTALAFVFKDIWILLLGRIIVGLSSGDQPIAQAAVIDVLPKNKQVKGLGCILFSLCLGIVLGPIIGYLFSERSIASWLGPEIPFYFIVCISIINILVLQLGFKETLINVRKHKISLTRSVQIFVSAFKHSRVRVLAFSFMLAQIGWSIYFLFTPDFIVDWLLKEEKQVAIFTALLGIGLSLSFMLLVPMIQKKIKPKLIFFLGMLLLGMISLFTGLLQNYSFILITSIFAGMLFALAYTYLVYLFSMQVKQDEQGWVMGITSSIMAFSSGIGVLLATFIAIWSPIAVYIVSFLFLAIAAPMILKKRIRE